MLFGARCAHNGGHAVARELLTRAWTELRGGSVPPVRRAPNGKPYFASGDLQFSLTHTWTMAFCAVSDEPVGVDAETIRPLRPGLERRICCPEELEWLAAQPDCNSALLALWTRKEAWVKYTGDGLNGRPGAVCVQPGASAVSGLCFRTEVFGDCLVTVCARRIPELRYVEKNMEEPGP